MPNALEVMVKKHLEKPQAALIYSRRFHCDERMSVFDVSEDDTGKFTSQLAMPLINHFTSFKKKFYDKTTGIDNYMKRAVDQDLYLKLEEEGEIAFVPVALYLYRHNINSISLNKNEYKAQAWHIYANGNACKRRGLSLDDYCDVIKPVKQAKIKELIFFFLTVAHRIKYKFDGKRRLKMYKKTSKNHGVLNEA
jgi:hypothetical protein